MAHVKVFLAPAAFSGLSPLLIYLIPPIIKNTNSTIKAKGIAAARTLAKIPSKAVNGGGVGSDDISLVYHNHYLQLYYLYVRL